ncbi:MAG: hypothetical protein GKR94_13445 [Gammaproteobacteria bacterium]|nr:hypothetical protein [Gammaproteobacteria bacterium]
MLPIVKGVTHPPAATALALGVLGLVSGWLIAGSVVLLVGAGLALRRASSAEVMMLDALSGLSVAVDDAARQRLTALVPGLRAARSVSGAERLGMQAYAQLTALCRGFISYRKVLSRRFSPVELTHGRYLKAGEQVFLAALDDLDRTAARLQGLAAVDVDQVRAQLRMLERLEKPSENEARERDTLRERLRLRGEEEDGVRGLLASNEQALTQLSAAHSSLARLRTERGVAQLEADSAMRQLEELSKRAQRYSIDAPQ